VSSTLEYRQPRWTPGRPATQNASPLKPAPAPILPVVIPVCHGIDSLDQLFTAVTAAARQLALPFEILFVDDGSTDGSF